jgi:hypothetical protein
MTDMGAYQSDINSLVHLAQCTRPDIALAVGALAPYKRGTFCGHAERHSLRRRHGRPEGASSTGAASRPWGFGVMYGGAVSWSSKRQPTTAAPTMEAEYQACGSVAREGLSVRKGQRVKHIDIIHHFARDGVVSGEALSRPLFEGGLVGVGMLRVESRNV